MDAQRESDLNFDDVRIDFAGRRLWRGGVVQPLEPKAFAVLALLAGAPGRVFARDDILDAVWGHRHVTPGVLNRIMTLLRQALGEDAQHPRRLHTVHGTGYRFDLPPSPPVDASAERRTQADRRSRATALAADRPRRARRLLALAFLLAGIALILWRALAPSPSSIPPSPAATIAATTPTLVVVPLKPIGDADGAATIAAGLSEELIGNLARIDGLRVIARESTQLAAAQSTDPAQLAQRLGITHLLTGSLQRDGQSLRVRLRLVEAGDGRALWAKDFDRDASEVLLLQREIAESVAASLALKLGLATTRVARSGDAEFLRRFLAAQALIDRRDLPAEESTDLAESEFRELLRERPDDARVHAALAIALEVRAQRKPPLAITLRKESQREAAIASRLDPSLPGPYAVQSGLCRENDWEHCLGLLAKACALAPSDPSTVGAYIVVLARLGYLDRAEQAQREMVARDPLAPGRHFWLGRILDTLGRHDEARLEFDQSDKLPSAYSRWFNAVWRRDYATALRVAEADIGSPDNPDSYAPKLAPGYLAASRALTDATLWPQAFAEFDKYELGTGMWNFSRVFAPGAQAHDAETIRKLNEIRQRGYSSWDLLLWTRDLVHLRRDPAFQDYLRDNGILDYWRAHGFPPQCRPQGDGAACD
ncbi:winged helix-turn-helix domain-containing protein [Dokdonella sp.]|uniref:winged helix-turn-helix domain-containing protein n=1 Tax=Dokdonella sp. TaxID=2291710 RepID=UPI001B0F4B3C|nr:winged helix-turn-helix domain-containing protein [Dokdonella sp.]MBO9664334.1 winged helix-turn-helix domain-containing protein [Dokdonella sp.]